MGPRTSRSPLIFAAVLVGVPGNPCSSETDDSENVLPDFGSLADAGPDEGDGGAGSSGYPAAFRLTCISIQQLGSVGADGFQTQLLSRQWQQDVADYKLNILFLLKSLDLEAGQGTLQVNSGVGTANDDICHEAQSISEDYSATVVEGLSPFRGIGSVERCVADEEIEVAGAAMLDFALGPDDRIYIHAQDDDGSVFNCTPDPATPDAVPLRRGVGKLGISADGQTAMGRLRGCLLFSEGSTLCSCLGSCGPGGPEVVQQEGACAGCPENGIPLTDMLLGVTSTEACTESMGEQAFDLAVDFIGERLPMVPTTCE